MKRLQRLPVAALALLGMACNASSALLTPTPDERAGQGVATPLSATPTAAPPISSPTLPAPTPGSTAEPSPVATEATDTPMPPPSTYVVQEERAIGSYTVQLWRSTEGETGLGFDNVATISADGQVLARVDSATTVDLSGTDLTGEGHPDVIIETYTGGAHCCFSTVVYDLGPTLTRVLETPASNCGGRFEDLDGDGVAEFVTCDDLFAYVYCAYAASPAVTVILKYEAGRGYIPASPRFASLYADEITAHRQMAENAVTDDLGEWDGTPKCSVLPPVLDYLYTGQPDRAWEALDQYYDYPDRKLFWVEVTRDVAGSSLYTPSAPLPDVSLPDYYMLQLLTHCGPERQAIGFLSEGQDACGPAVPQRDIYWLDRHLRDTGLLTEGERLELEPEGCMTNCRLDVIRTSDQARVGSIRLDTTVGFPGAVYRTDGEESARWRLRGDLTWEQTSS